MARPQPDTANGLKPPAELATTDSSTRPAVGQAARRLRVAGHVQGVGFRPYVFRLAREFDLGGTVQNLRGEVEIIIEGARPAIERFAQELIARAPPLARPRVVLDEAMAPAARANFHILDSSAAEPSRISVPPDYFTCAECLRELADPRDRRYGYPFINCTQCGPRYTLIEALPYDRANTTMARFELCAACRSEYENPLDRRFHAEPVACPQCGPRLTLVMAERPALDDTQTALRHALGLLRAGRVIAVRGIGGYHLMCDAANELAVRRLRDRKGRPDKPLAVMCPLAGPDGLDAARALALIDEQTAAALISPARPIVLVRLRGDASLAPSIAPGLAELGLFLPYSPLHALLLDGFGAPLVATSGNVSGEPVLTEPEEAETRLRHVADAFLHHDRPIARPADDSVLRPIAGRVRPIRQGRGAAPIELEAGCRFEQPVVAVGGHLKTTVALAWDERVVVSPHIGDMGTPRSEMVLTRVVEDLQRLYGVRATRLVCDRHPAYGTSRWARSTGLPVSSVLHHHAHASALVAEHGLDAGALVFTWDGLGFGADGTLWGGEAFVGRPGRWRRVASLRTFRLPGGDKAARAPWRSAAGICWEVGRDWIGPTPDAYVRTAWERGINSPTTSAVGRLFDAAAAIVLGVRETSYEGQGPMMLEAVAEQSWGDTPHMTVAPDAQGLLRLDWLPLIDAIADGSHATATRAAWVHRALTEAMVEVACRVRSADGVDTVGLTGGVFQNQLLTNQAIERLTACGFRVLLAERLPCNDGGLSYGQVMEYVAGA